MSEKQNTICIFSALYEPHVGGVENYTKALAYELINQGCRVIIVTSNHANLPSIENPSKNLTIYRLPCRPLLNARLPLPKKNKQYKELLTRVENEPIDHICINTRFYPHSQIGAQLAAKKGIVPVVIDHGSDYLTLGNGAIDALIKRYEHFMTNKLKKYKPLFYAVSERSSQWLRTFNVESNGEIHNAIDYKQFLSKDSGRKFRTEYEIPEEATVVAFVGRLAPEKGARELIEAAQLLKDKDDLYFLVAGEGTLQQELTPIATPHTIFLGALSTPDVVALLNTADIFCLPSRSEGFATVLLEAASCSAAPIITNVGGVSELIPNSSYGIVLPNRNAATIAKAIKQLCDDRELLHNIATNINNRVKTNYNWQESAQALMQAFNKAQLG